METEASAEAQLREFDQARDQFIEAMEAVPPEALGFLKPGDEYSLGGLAFHVNYSLEHYATVLEEMISTGFSECTPRDPDGLRERANARAQGEVSREQLSEAIAETRRLHQHLSDMALAQDDWDRSAPVHYGGPQPTPTCLHDLLGWVTGHYLEHVPHVAQLLDEWRSGWARSSGSGVAVVERFNEAFGRGDIDAVMALMTSDCVFENTYPAPDGERFQGQAAVRAFWERFFGETVSPRFDTEETIGAGDRVVVRWRFSWGEPQTGHVRGIDVFTVRDGKVSEKLSYVKG